MWRPWRRPAAIQRAFHMDSQLHVFDLENVPVKDLTSRLAQAAAKPLERVA